MLAVAFTEKTIAGMVFSILVAAVATYFAQPTVFDPIVLICIAAIGIFFRRNIDLLTICAAIVAERAFEELMWRVLENTLMYKVPAYIVFLIAAYWLSKGLLRYGLMAFVAIGIAAEAYWYLTDYKAPYVVWMYLTLIEAIALARFFKMRAFWLLEINHKMRVKPIVLDTQLIIAFYGFAILYGLVIIEYYIRHILGFKEVTAVFEATRFIASSLAIYKLYLIILHSIEHLKSIELDA